MSDKANHQGHVLDVVRDLVRAEARALLDLETQIDERVLEVAARVVAVRGRILTAGMGTSGETARRLAHLLAVTGTPAFFVHAADALHGGLGAITDDDLIFAISKGGETTELNDFVQRAVERGAWVVAVTGESESGLSRVSSEAIVLRTRADADPGGMIAMGSTLVMSAWGDAIAIAAMEMRKYAWDEVLSTHPGGAVGMRGASQRLEAHQGQASVETTHPRSIGTGD